MSNNKQTMKLYTENDLIDLVQSLKDYTHESRSILGHDERDAKEFVHIFLKDKSPIELPSDEEIEAHVEDDFINAIEIHKYSEEAQLLMKAMCKAGAKWMRDKIGGNNEQQ